MPNITIKFIPFLTWVVLLILSVSGTTFSLIYAILHYKDPGIYVSGLIYFGIPTVLLIIPAYLIRAFLKKRTRIIASLASNNNWRYARIGDEHIQREKVVPDAASLHKTKIDDLQYKNVLYGQDWHYYDFSYEPSAFDDGVGPAMLWLQYPYRRYYAIFTQSLNINIPHIFLSSKGHQRKKGPFFSLSNQYKTKSTSLPFRIYANQADHKVMQQIFTNELIGVLSSIKHYDIEIVNSHIIIYGTIDSQPAEQINDMRLLAQALQANLHDSNTMPQMNATINSQATSVTRHKSLLQLTLDYFANNLTMAICAIILLLIFVPWLISLVI